MKKLFPIFIVSLCFGVIAVLLWTDPAYAPPGCSPVAQNLATCNQNLDACLDDLATCQAEPNQIFPGDGYPNPDSFGVSGHGPALSYTDNGDGTFTDNNTKLVWEEKNNNGGNHDFEKQYTWTNTPYETAPDGTLFTLFLYKLNNTCENDETVDCSSGGDTDCTGVGGVCGFAGYRDWRIPNVKELLSIMDYSKLNPASSVPGFTKSSSYWSATTNQAPYLAMLVIFTDGPVLSNLKSNEQYARAVRP